MLEEIADERETRFNDVIADPEGRVFCGTMPTQARNGRLYRLDRDASLHLVLEDIGSSNGMGFTARPQGLYYTDSRATSSTSSTTTVPPATSPTAASSSPSPRTAAPPTA